MKREWRSRTEKFPRMVVLDILIAMLVGSVVCMFVIPPFLFKIERTGRVDFFGIKFL